MHTPASRHALLVPTLLALWFLTNSLFALSSHSLLLSPSAPWPLFLDLTILQALVSFLLSHLPLFPAPSTPYPPLPPSIPLLHLLSVTLTNASYALLGAAPTLLLKLLEPLPTFLLSRYLLPNPPPLHKLLSLVPLLSGTLLFTIPAHPLPALSPILLSTISYPLRNILLTRHTPASTPSTPALSHLLPRFRALHAPLVAPLCLLALVKFFLSPPALIVSISALPAVFLNATLFATYHLASLALLAQLRPLSHSLANSLKRFTTVVVATVGTGVVFGREQAVGLALTVIGFGGYVLGGRLVGRGAGKHSGALFRLVMAVVGVVSVILVGGVVAQKGRGVGAVRSVEVETAGRVGGPSDGGVLTMDSVEAREDGEDVGTTKVAVEEREEVRNEGRAGVGEKVREGLVVVHVERTYVPGRDNAVVRNYAEGQVMQDGGNSGNFVWQHASYVSLVGLEAGKGKGWEVCWGNRPDCYEDRVAGRNGTSMVSYRPGANYFNLGRPQAFAADVEMMQTGEAVPMLLGIGVQAGFAKNSSEALDLADGRTVEVEPQDHVFTDLAKKFLGLMQKRGNKMLVRGDFTKAALRIQGYNHAVSAGCPTLFLSKQIWLGRPLQNGYDRLKRRIGDTSLKVGINVKGGNRYMKFVKAMLAKYPNSVIYAQGRGDMVYLEKWGIPFNRVRMFTNVEAWREDMRSLDLSIGARIHGNMVAVSVGVPVLVVAPDWRVLELAQRMKIRHLSYWQAGKVLHEDTDLAKMVTEVAWDAVAFDLNRCEMARRFRDTLSAVRVPVAQHVEAIAEAC